MNMTGMLLAAGDPLNHVVSHPIKKFGAIVIDNHVVMQVTATFLMLLLLVSAFRSYRKSPKPDDVESLVPKGSANFFEWLCDALRTHVARPALGEHTDRFMPYIWTVFFFVLFMNLLGMVPIDAALALIPGFADKHLHIGGTATGNWKVTGALAACTLLLILINGLRIGGKEFVAHFCPGPLWLAPLLVPVEIIGLAAKVIALAIRLFANMMAGHILLAVLIGFATSYLIGAVAIVGAVAISCLEIFVAFLQAYIFTFLTTLFLGQAVIFHHDDHGHDHAEAAH